MADQAGSLTFRAHTSEDIPLIMDSWGRSAWRGTVAHRCLSPEEFHSFHRPIRERLFAKPNVAIIVCCDSADPWHAVGWIAVEKIPSGTILHYLYVKSAVKGEGIAYQLIRRAIPSPPVFYSHLTQHAQEIIRAKPERFGSWVYLPHLV